MVTPTRSFLKTCARLNSSLICMKKTDATMYAILLQNDLHGLKHLYEGTYKNMYSWSLALEYEQGIVRYEKCFANNGAPDVLEEIGNQLLDLFEIQ